MPNIVIKEANQSERSFGYEFVSNSELYAPNYLITKGHLQMDSGIILHRLAIESLNIQFPPKVEGKVN